jgi:NAD(P)-dependent dehydrogenase (short-subunit alcohol dehydrogenase family)
MAAYSAAKHGVDGLMESLRLELAAVGSNVSVAVVHPGPVDTPFWKHVRPVGTRPPEPPAAYSVDRVARAVVGAALGSRGSSPVGVAMRLALLMRGVARPFSDLGLAAVARWALDNPGSSQLRTFVRRALSSA